VGFRGVKPASLVPRLQLMAYETLLSVRTKVMRFGRDETRINKKEELSLNLLGLLIESSIAGDPERDRA
jgi:hypothetical protein